MLKLDVGLMLEDNLFFVSICRYRLFEKFTIEQNLAKIATIYQTITI